MISIIKKEAEVKNSNLLQNEENYVEQFKNGTHNLNDKASEVTNSLNQFGVVGISALRSVVRNHQNNLDWWQNEVNRMLRELNDGLEETEDYFQTKEDDSYILITEVYDAVEEAINFLNYKMPIFDDKNEIVGYENLECTDLADELMSVFDEYLETYYVE